MDPVKVFGFFKGPEDTILIPFEAFNLRRVNGLVIADYQIPLDIPPASDRDDARFKMMNNPDWDSRKLEYREFTLKELDGPVSEELKTYLEKYREPKPV